MQNQFSTGDTLWGYKVVKILGEGGMGEIYQVLDPHNSRYYAAKVIRAEKLADPAVAAQFDREMSIHPDLQHDSIVRVYRVEHSPRGMLMQFVSGGSVRDKIKQQGDKTTVALSPEQMFQMIEQMASALSYLHAYGVVHCDLKPDNVLIEGSRYYLTDFGISQTINQPLDARRGTPKYMAPEQFQPGAIVDSKTDVYSFGILIYEILAGRTPFNRQNFSDDENITVAKQYERLHTYEPPTPLRQINPKVRSGIEYVVMKALAKDPMQRYSSVQAFYEDIASAYSGQITTTYTTRPSVGDTWLERKLATDHDIPPKHAILVCTRSPIPPLKNAILFDGFAIGRSKKVNGLILDDPSISRLHVSFAWNSRENKYFVLDQASSGGTRVNGRPLAAKDPYPLQHGDLLTIGNYNFRYEGR